MKWNIKERAPEEFIKKFPEYPLLVLQLLYDRGLTSQKEIDEFFNPDYLKDLHDPFLMLGMKEAVKRIEEAIKKQEKIAIYADYDCDGVCGAIILETAFKKIGADVGEIYIPDKAQEGYGLNEKAIEKLKANGIKLVITVDCGITNNREIDFAKSVGVDVMVIDHHQIVGEPPKAIVVDPHQEGDMYPFKDLSGAGVAFKFVQALIVGKKDITEGWEKWLLDLVALATVADLVPLLGENRTLVKYGLVVLAQTKRVGLRELMSAAGVNPILEITRTDEPVGVSLLVSRIEAGMRGYATNLTARILGFALAPRLNAASRMEHANIAYKLLVSQSVSGASALAKKLDGLNKERQKLVDNIVREIESSQNLSDGKIIFAASSKWPIGVAGLVASRLTDKYNQPSFIFNIENNRAKGSVRSVNSFNAVDVLSAASELLESFGGHPRAAGCTLRKEKLKELKNFLEEKAERELKNDDLIARLDIDYEVKGQEINWQIYDEIHKFVPFGKDNPSPMFILRGAEIINMRAVGNSDKHLKLELKVRGENFGEEKKLQAIGFNHGVRYDELKIGGKIDIVFEFLVNEWNGNRELQLKIIDLKTAV